MSTFNEYFVDTLKNRYADFEGRARRSEFWYFNLYAFLVILLCMALVGIGVATEIFILSTIGGIAYLIVALAMIIPNLAVSIRRLHDIGKSGWMILIAFIPIVGSIMLLVFCVTDSQREPNQWGPNPKGESEDWEL